MIAEERVENLTVDKEGDRIDVYIANHLNLSRTRVQNLVEDGCVLLNGLEARKSERLEVGQEIEVRLPVPVPLKLEPEDIELDIYFQDSSIIVVNKPAGMVVHPGPGHYKGTLVNALLSHVSDLSGIGGILRPGIVHRLDKDTSGLMVVAKTDDAHQALSGALQRREIKRCYQTVSWGHLAESPLEVNAPIGRDPSRRHCMKVIKSGRHAVTHFRVIEDWGGAELLEVALETGRTHQIRVHLAHIGHPVVGDSVYGLGWERGMNGRVRSWAKLLNDRISRQFLHAWHLSFRHPISKEVLTFQSPLPEDLSSCAEWARSGEGF